jgi:hypothetical protein
MLVYAVLCGILGWRNRWTHDPPHIGVIGRVLEPPDDLPPALAAWLLKPPEVTPQALLIATLFDLARRGHLRLEQRTSRVNPGRQRFTLFRQERPADLLAPFEQFILDTLLEDAPQADVSATAAETIWAKQRLQQLCEIELVELGLLDRAGPRRRRAYVRNAWLVGLLGPVAVAVTALVAGAVTWWGWVLLVVGVLICWGVGGMYNDVRGTTQQGADARAAWSEFASFLKQLTPERAPDGRFAALLPFAVAFGTLKPFVAAYLPRHPTLPAWYAPNLPPPPLDGKTVDLERLQAASPAAEEMRKTVRSLERDLTTPSSGG